MRPLRAGTQALRSLQHPQNQPSKAGNAAGTEMHVRHAIPLKPPCGIHDCTYIVIIDFQGTFCLSLRCPSRFWHYVALAQDPAPEPLAAYAVAVRPVPCCMFARLTFVVMMVPVLV